METISAEEYKKRYGEVGLKAFAETAKEQGAISKAFQGGISQAKQGYGIAANATSPFGKLAGGMKELAGGVTAAMSPLAPVTQYIGKGIDYAADKLSDTSLIKGAAGNQVVRPGGATEYVPNESADTVPGFIADTSEVLGVTGGGKGIVSKGRAAINTAENVTTSAKGAVSKAGSYARSVTGDVIPTAQRFINEEVAKALDLTPSDLSNISKATGNDVGQWLSDNNLIGKNKAETQANIKEHFEKNYGEVRKNIKAVTNVYKQSQVPRYVDALKQIELKVKGVPGLEKTAVEVENMLNKKEVTLEDVQKVKEMLDEHYNLYKVTGDVGEGVAKEGLANIRSEIKTFIEDQVQEATGADIRAMNNSVSTAKSLGDAITTRDPKGLTRSNLRMGDMAVFGLGTAFGGGPLTGLALLFAKKLRESPTVRLRMARMVDKWSDAQKAKAAAELQKGIIPQEFAPFVKQKDKVGVTPQEGRAKP